MRVAVWQHDAMTTITDNRYLDARAAADAALYATRNAAKAVAFLPEIDPLRVAADRAQAAAECLYWDILAIIAADDA